MPPPRHTLLRFSRAAGPSHTCQRRRPQSFILFKDDRPTVSLSPPATTTFALLLHRPSTHPARQTMTRPVASFALLLRRRLSSRLSLPATMVALSGSAHLHVSCVIALLPILCTRVRS